MSSRRPLHWSAAMHTLEADRASLSPIRECPMRSVGRLSTGQSLTAWRGRSGRRYVAIIVPLTREDAFADKGGVALAVRRDATGAATIIAVRSCAHQDPGFLGWLAACCQRGTTELHILTLAEGEAECAAVAVDLTDRAPARAAA